MAIRSLPFLPYLALLFPIPHFWLMGRVMTYRQSWELRDVAAGFILLFEALFVLLVLTLLKLSWIRLHFKWMGLGLLLATTIAMWQGSSKDAFALVFSGGWLVLLILSGLWLYSQRKYLD
jgi:hypothetical protein